MFHHYQYNSIQKLNCIGANPLKRYTIEQCLGHPYFEGISNTESEPACDSTFDWSFDNFKPTKEKIQGMIYDFGLEFHPD